MAFSTLMWGSAKQPLHFTHVVQFWIITFQTISQCLIWDKTVGRPVFYRSRFQKTMRSYWSFHKSIRHRIARIRIVVLLHQKAFIKNCFVFVHRWSLVCMTSGRGGAAAVPILNGTNRRQIAPVKSKKWVLTCCQLSNTSGTWLTATEPPPLWWWCLWPACTIHANR